MKRLTLLAAIAGAALFAGAASAQTNIAIATGGTGGVYYPLGGALANVLTKSIPGVQATAEVTGGGIDNGRHQAIGKIDHRHDAHDGLHGRLRRHLVDGQRVLGDACSRHDTTVTPPRKAPRSGLAPVSHVPMSLGEGARGTVREAKPQIESRSNPLTA